MSFTTPFSTPRGGNTNKWKQHVRQPNRARIYANRPNAFYRLTDGRFLRAMEAFRGTVMRRCDEHGRILPRVRMSKKMRLACRRMQAAVDAAV